jgi:hypothetical protein
MIIRYSDSSTAHAVLYRLTGDTMRAAVEGADDAAEFKLICGAWTSDQGVVVSFEFPLETSMDPFENIPVMHFGEAQAHCAAGGNCVLRRMAAAGGGKPAN